jgi:hypothetical protein
MTLAVKQEGQSLGCLSGAGPVLLGKSHFLMPGPRKIMGVTEPFSLCTASWHTNAQVLVPRL